MNTNELHGWEKFASEELADASVVQSYVGHEHFWQRAFSRRNFMVGAGGAAGLTIGNKLGLSALLQAQNLTTSIGQSCSAAPKPIPGGIQPFGPGTEVFHVFAPPGPGKEPSTITDFKGSIGLAALHGGGTGTDASGHSFPLFYSVDVRFMKGTYIGEDSKTHHGTFAFT